MQMTGTGLAGDTRSGAGEKYRPALELYRSSDLTVKEICEMTGTSVSAFRAYLRRCHRELMFARYGIDVSHENAESARLRHTRGQTPAAHLKYRDAVAACDDIKYIGLNVSQIARLFGLDPTALGNQLRNHYPEIMERREKERRRLGINDNLHRGAKAWCTEQYADAVEHLRTSDDTIRQTAELFNISYSGLREHILYYHKDLIRKRSDRRRSARTDKVRGALTGNGGRHEPKEACVEKYSDALQLYRDTAMTQKEICSTTGVSLTGFRHHLRTWNRELVMEHRDVDCRAAEGNGTKRYLKSTAAKYAAAIARLKEGGISTAGAARQFGLHPEVFREYLHEHEPELAAGLGMTTLENGKPVLARSAQKYAEAIRIYRTTTEPLKSIARRLGLTYNSLNSFIRRNCPDVIPAHNSLLHQGESRADNVTP